MSTQDNATNNANDMSLPPVDPAASQAANSDNDNTATTVPSTALPPQPNQSPQTPPQATTAAQATQDNAAPLIADDADLIEKAWVEKAKQLVEQTKDDPYAQNKEINKFKAQYIKKRYNKDIQLDNK